MRHFLWAPLWLVALLFSDAALAQIRFVTYNTLEKPFDAASDAQFKAIFGAIAAKQANGVAKRVDVLALQEQQKQGSINSAARAAGLLNELHGVSSYQWSSLDTGVDRLAFVYDSATVTKISDIDFDIGTRPAHRIGFRPVGYTSPDSVFYAYSAHLKASQGGENVAQRNFEANNIRSNVASLGAGANAIVAGDLNLYSPTEDAFVTFTASGSGQVRDPLQLSSWTATASRRYMTQSTRTGDLMDGGASGGLDDRFDFQLITPTLLDGEGLSYLGPTSTGLGSLQHSYQAFGNDGTSLNQNITSPSAGRSQPASVLSALYNFSDHLPVVADYQVPAALAVATAQAPASLMLGEAFSLNVFIRNIASVVASVGADELDWVLATTGSLSGAGSGTSLALTSANLVQVAFDTSTVGLKSGTLSVSTSSQAAASALVSIPFSYEVVAPVLVGDFNSDGFVDAADYTVWRDTLLSETDLRADADGNNIVNSADYLLWRDSFVQPAAIGASGGVPEPQSVALGGMLLVIGLGYLVRRDRRCQALVSRT